MCVCQVTTVDAEAAVVAPVVTFWALTVSVYVPAGALSGTRTVLVIDNVFPAAIGIVRLMLLEIPGPDRVTEIVVVTVTAALFVTEPLAATNCPGATVFGLRLAVTV